MIGPTTYLIGRAGKREVAEGACSGAAHGHRAMREHGHQAVDSPCLGDVPRQLRTVGCEGQRLQCSRSSCLLLQIACTSAGMPIMDAFKA